MTSAEPARYAIRLREKPLRVSAGERYRVSAWIRPGDNFRAEPETPGVVLRLTFHAAPGLDAPAGHAFVGLDGVTIGSDPLARGSRSLSNEWTKIEAVVEIPPGVREMMFFVFCWKSTGAVCIADPLLERVAANTPLTALAARRE